MASSQRNALIIHENGLRFGIDMLGGQKTGFYIDQRRNRQRVRELVNGRCVLNCFSYTGAFSVYALAGGAREVLSVDSSADACAGALKMSLRMASRQMRPAGKRGMSFRCCARCAIEAKVTTRSFSTHLSLPRPQHRLNGRRAAIRISIYWRSSCCARVVCCSPSPARVGYPQICSRKLLRCGN
jgi:hypothetical protein